MDEKAPSVTARSLTSHRSAKASLAELYSHFKSRDHVLITIDPDPDAIGSALALKRLLWHKVQSTTIGIIRPIRRLNNLTMVRLLRIPLVLLKDVSVDAYTRYLLVDSQPHHNDFFRRLSYTVVIDHHPLNTPVAAPFTAIYPQYGATATILTQYLREAKIKPSQGLATTLLYAIKTDTRNFERHTTEADIDAFRYLFRYANHHIMRKIEISDLALSDLRYFQKAVARKHVARDRIFAHLDEVPSADILVEIAEFFLKIHDISWSIVSGIYEGHLIISVRSDGYRKDAGRTVRKAFESIGCAGGHQAMARVEIPMDKVTTILGKASSRNIEAYIRRQLSPM
ncbi:MAG: phosphoesterase [Deltaproteobacteria bacterium]|nr:phosphoesterase [Deltaproteobacteria bacterium]